GQLLEVENARLQPAPSLWITTFHVHEEGLDHDRPVREAPAGRGAGGRLRIGDRLELDLRRAGQGEEALLVRAVGPELRVDRVGDQSRRGFMVLDGGEESRFAELAG